MGKNSVWKKPEKKDEQVVEKNRIFGRPSDKDSKADGFKESTENRSS